MHIPHRHGLSESVRYQNPNRSGRDLAAAFNLLWDAPESSDHSEKLFATCRALLKNPDTPLKLRASLINWSLQNSKQNESFSELSEIIADALDEISAIRNGATISADEQADWVAEVSEKIGSAFPNRFKFDMDDSALEKLFKSAKIPTIRLFNAFMRTKTSTTNRIQNTKFARNVQKNLENVGLKMSPATFSEYFQLIDETHQNHLTRQMMEWDFQKEGFLEASSDFKDYEAFENIGQFFLYKLLNPCGFSGQFVVNFDFAKND